MKIVAFDPGYAMAAVVLIRATKAGAFTVLKAAVVSPPTGTKEYEKVVSMINTLTDLKKSHTTLFRGDAAIAEGQTIYPGRYSGSAGVRVGNTLIKLGAVTGACLVLADAKYKTIVTPRIWNKSRSKEQTEDRVRKALTNPDWRDWDWVRKPRRSDVNHLVDGIGMAMHLWGDLTGRQDPLD